MMAVQEHCRRPKLSDLGFYTDDPSVFYRAQWKKFPRYLFVIYRVFLALYLLGILIANFVTGIETLTGRWFVYLTNLGFTVFVIYVNVAGVIALVDGFLLRNRNNEGMGIRHKIHWFFFSTTMGINIIVTGIYWSVLYSPKSRLSLFYDFHVHLLTTIISLIDLFLTAIPVRFLHFIYPLGFSIAYLILTLINWGAGGDVIYPFLDYSNSVGVSVGVILGVLVALTAVHSVTWILYKLRMWIWMKCENNVTVEDTGNMEGL